MPIKTAGKITIALGGGVALLTVLAVIALIAVARMRHDAARVTRAHEVRSQLALFDRHLREARSNARSLLLLGDTVHLGRYRASVDSAEAAYLLIGRLTAGDAGQQNRLRLLRPVLDERIASLQRVVALRGSGAALVMTPTVYAELAQAELLSRHVAYAIAELDVVESEGLGRVAADQRRTEQATFALLVLFAVVGPGLATVMGRSIKSDLDARARAEAELRASEAKFAGILAIAVDAIVSIDETHAIRHFNVGAERIFGYQASEVLGRPLDLLLPARMATGHRAHVAGFAQGSDQARQMGQRRQVLGRRRDGEEFPAEASISKLATPTGTLFTAVLRDVSDQRRRQQQDQLLAAAGKALIDTLEYDSVLRAVAALPIPGVGAWSVLDVADQEGGRASFVRVCATQRPELQLALRSLETTPLNQDSPSRCIDVMRSGKAEIAEQVTDEWLEAHCDEPELSAWRALRIRSMLIVPLTIAGRTHGVLTIGADESRRSWDPDDVAVAEELAERGALAIDIARSHHRSVMATRARDEILGIVSHDLRNPLSAIAMCARRLIEDPPRDDRERGALYRSILDASDWTHRLVQDLLDAASIDAGRLSIEMDEQSVPALVEASLDLFEGRARTLGIRLSSDVPGDVPRVRADGARIVQVLSNLLSNAVKYSSSGQRVLVAARSQGDEVVLSVQDSGPGIAAEDLTRVFDRFWHKRGAAKGPSAGLGLAIAHGIVTAHGGRIWVESTPGAGSTFSFTLPATTRVVGVGVANLAPASSDAAYGPASHTTQS